MVSANPLPSEPLLSGGKKHVCKELSLLPGRKSAPSDVSDHSAHDMGLTLSLDEPRNKLDSLFSNKSSAFKWPAAPGSGGKLDSPNSKLGDGGFGGVGD